MQRQQQQQQQHYEGEASALGQLNVPYALCEALVAVCAVLGNGLVILVFARERKLRRRTNYYIISLATADLLVGLFAIPFAILASVGLPTNLHACLFTVSLLVVLCTISIFCLVAVSVDRYWAILHPMGYSRTVRTRTAIGIICLCWVAGSLVGFLPLLGWNAGHQSDVTCIFTEVMDYNYLVFLYFATIIFPALLIAAFYAHIYRVVVKQLQQIVTMNPVKRVKEQQQQTAGSQSRDGKQQQQQHEHGTMLRLLGAAQKREVKATQNLSRIVVFFIICWFPLYTINCVMAFCPECRVSDLLLNACIILSHVNSAGNPLLYAYHLKDFRAALKSFIHRLVQAPASAASQRQQQQRPANAARGGQQPRTDRPSGPIGPGAGARRATGLALVQHTASGWTAGSEGAVAATRSSLSSQQQRQMRSVVDLMSVHALPQAQQPQSRANGDTVEPNKELRIECVRREDEVDGDGDQLRSAMTAYDYGPELQFADEDESRPESLLVIEADVNRSDSSSSSSSGSSSLSRSSASPRARSNPLQR